MPNSFVIRIILNVDSNALHEYVTSGICFPKHIILLYLCHSFNEVLSMRRILLSLFILINSIAIFVSITETLSINYFSIRLIIAFFTLVISIFFILIKSNHFNHILAIMSVILAASHLILIAHSAYIYLY